MKRLLLECIVLIALVMVVGVGMVAVGDQMYRQGYQNGHADGIRAGYKNGEHDGYMSGYAKGQADQLVADGSDYQNGYSAGQQDFSDFYDYLVNSCGKDYSGYYHVVVYKSSSNGTFHYTCIA